MQVGDPRLRNGMQAQPLRLLAKEAGDKRFDHVGFDLFGKTLANNRRRNMAAPEPGNARHLLILLDQRFGLPAHFFGRHLDLDLAFGGAFFGRAFVDVSGAHNYLSRRLRRPSGGAEDGSTGTPYAASLSVKTRQEDRQTQEGDILPTKVTGRF